MQLLEKPNPTDNERRQIEFLHERCNRLWKKIQFKAKLTPH